MENDSESVETRPTHPQLPHVFSTNSDPIQSDDRRNRIEDSTGVEYRFGHFTSPFDAQIRKNFRRSHQPVSALYQDFSGN